MKNKTEIQVPEPETLKQADSDAFESELMSEFNSHVKMSESAPEEPILNNTETAPEPEPTSEPSEPSKTGPTVSVNPEEKPSGNLNRNFAELLRPDLVLIIFDVIFSSLCYFAVSRLLKIECQKDEFSLTKKEAEQLEPILAEWLKTVNFNLTPGQMLLIASGIIYGSKVGIKIFLNKTGSSRTVSEASEAKTAAVHKTKKARNNFGATRKEGETRGRHKKDCTCPKCMEKKGGNI